MFQFCFHSRLNSLTFISSAWFLVLIATPSILMADWKLSDMVGKDSQGRTVYRSIPVPKELQNQWPRSLEEEFQARARATIAAQAKIKTGVNTYFENEKRSYGYLMAHVLSEDAEKAAASLKALQARDHQHQEWHRETDGIDYYAAFTIKHQMRKYFYFGDLLDKDYKHQMFEGGKKWTTQDPMRRPHYAYKGPKPGWGPDAKNSWVDIRSTENLFLMRVTSVYLIAETTGNKKTAAKYKELILKYTATLFRIGVGEWDSENYLGHSIGPLLNLYDFATDLKVKRAAKACLDFYFLTGAIKYYRGGFNGPTKRDYNHAQPFGGSAANMLWLMFGDSRFKTDHWESDEVHLITSAYRAPIAAVDIAKKNFAKPVVIYSSKPHYSATTSLDQESPPAYLETQYVGKTFQMGSLAGGTRPGKDDVNGFKIISTNNKNEGVVIQGVPGSDPNFVGSPMYQAGKVDGENRVAQYRNVAVWLVKNGKADWSWVVPESFQFFNKDGVVILQGDQIWIAMHPVGTTSLKVDKNAEKKLATKKGRKFPGHYVLTAKGNTNAYCGVAIEVAEKSEFKNLDSFIKHANKASLNLEKVNKGIVQFKTKSGKWLGFHWNDNPHNLGVWKNGKRHDFRKHSSFLYRSDSDQAVIESQWGTGILEATTPGQSYRCEVDLNGDVKFRF